MKLHKICLLALGSRTNLFYLRLINESFQLNSDAEHVYSVVVKKMDFESINKWLPDNFSQLEEIVSQQLAKVNGFEKILIPNVTLHETVDRLFEKSNYSYPIVHPVESVIAKLMANNCTKIMLVSSLYGMNADQLKSYFLNNGLEVVVPNHEQQVVIDDFRKKVYGFRETNEDVTQYLTLLSHYQQDNDVVLACTELSLMTLTAADNLYDMSREQINQAIGNN